MCNRYGNAVTYRQYVDDLKAAHLPLVSPSADKAPNLEIRDNIFPTEKAPLLRPVAGGLELVHLRWGLIPWFHKQSIKEWKMLTTNARSETLKTTQTFKNSYQQKRCLIPVTQFYEWTGEKGKKTKWSFARPDRNWFCFAGLWDQAHTTEGVVESFALVTIEAGPDMAPYHTRQPVTLEREHYQKWLDQEDPQELFKPSPEGSFTVKQVAS